MRLGEPAQPPTDLPVDGVRREQGQGVYRRDVLIALGAALAVGVGEAIVGIDPLRDEAINWLLHTLTSIGNKNVDPNEPARFVAIEGTATEQRPESVPYCAPWVCVPGLGVGDGIGVGNVVRDKVLDAQAKWTEVYGIVYPEKGIDLNEIAQELKRVAKGHGRLNAATESAGLLVFLAALDLANKQNIADGEPVIQLDTLAIVSSPLGLEYVEPVKREGVEFVGKYDIEGGRVVELAYREVMRRRRGVTDADLGRYALPGWAGKAIGWLADMIEHGFEKTGHYVAPKVLTDCMQVIYDWHATTLLSSLAEKGTFTARSEICYCKSPPGVDDLVLSERACNDLRACAFQIKVPFDAFTYDGRHADTPAAFTEFGPEWRRRQAMEWKMEKAAERAAADLPRQEQV